MADDLKTQALRTQARRAEAGADESAKERSTGGVMMAMIIATVLGVTSALSVPNRSVETPASEATEQSIQESAAQPSPLPAQAPNEQAIQSSAQPLVQQPIAQPPLQQPIAQPPVQPSILPSEPIYQQSQPNSNSAPVQP